MKKPTLPRPLPRNSSLTAMQVQHMKPAETRYEVPAGPPAGLYLVIQTSGSKSWALRYRWRRMPRKLTLGSYPDMSLAVARAQAEACLEELATGIDPAAKKEEEAKQEEQENPDTAAAVAEEWFKRYVRTSNVRPRSQKEIQWIFNREVLPRWKGKLITEIGTKDVLRLLDAIVDRGAGILANRTLSYLKSWFNWCVDVRRILEVSPVAGIKKPAAEHTRERVLGDHELAAIWSITERLGYPSGPYLKVLLLCAQRRGEVATLRWEDVNLERRIWTLSAEQTKAGRLHDVPLSSQLAALLADLPRFDGPYVFTTTSGKKPVNGFSKMKERIDAALKAAGHELEDWTMHDLRRSAATWMAGAGVPPHVLSALLNHSPGSLQGVTSIYNRFRYVEERRAALESWAAHLLTIAEAESIAKAKAG